MGGLLGLLAGPLTGGIIAAVLYWFAFLRSREASAPRSEVPIGGGPEEELPGEVGSAGESGPDA